MFLKNISILLFIGLSSYAQTRIPTPQQAAETFRNADIVNVATYTEDEPMYALLNSKNIGEILINTNDMYKIEGKKDVMLHHYGSLYLDSELYSPEEIEVATKEAIAGYKKGTPFTIIIERYHPGDGKELARQEGTSNILTGGIGPALDSHGAGDIFFVDDNGSRYIVVKNSESQPKKAVQVVYLMYE